MPPSEDNARSNREARAQEGQQRYYRGKTSKSPFHEDAAWVHWEYSPEEWVLFEKVDWMPIRLRFWGVTVGCAASVVAAILPWFFFSLRGGDESQFLIVYLSALLGWCVFLPLVIMHFFSYINARKRHKARQQEPRTVTFSREGVWEAGTFFPLNKFLTANLKKVTLTFDPPVLHFRLRIWPSGKNWRSSPTSSALHVPVPRGREEEAGFLLERFQTEVIQARVQLEQRLNNPPEPR